MNLSKRPKPHGTLVHVKACTSVQHLSKPYMPSNPHFWSRPPLVNRHGSCLKSDAPMFDAPDMNVSTASHHLAGWRSGAMRLFPNTSFPPHVSTRRRNRSSGSTFLFGVIRFSPFFNLKHYTLLPTYMVFRTARGLTSHYCRFLRPSLLATIAIYS